MNQIRLSSTALQAFKTNSDDQEHNNEANFNVDESKNLTYHQQHYQQQQQQPDNLSFNQTYQSNLTDNNLNFILSAYQTSNTNQSSKNQQQQQHSYNTISYKQNSITNNFSNFLINNNQNGLIPNQRNRSFIIEKKLTIPNTGNNSNILKLIYDDTALLTKVHSSETDNEKIQNYRAINRQYPFSDSDQLTERHQQSNFSGFDNRLQENFKESNSYFLPISTRNNKNQELNSGL